MRGAMLGLAALLTLAPLQAGARQPEPLPESSADSIGYPDAPTALGVLKARADVKISLQHGWTIVEDPVDKSVWSFTPPDHEAYPAAVKRWPAREDGRLLLKMAVNCHGTKAACDQLVRDFQELNQQMIDAIRDRR